MTDVTQGELVPDRARVNEHGSPCPPWCAIDHGRPAGPGASSGKPAYISTHISAPGPHAAADAVAIKGGMPYSADAPAAVQLRAGGCLVEVGPYDALQMARLLDKIAAGAVSPADCAHLAARVRAAHAVATAWAAQ
jgi:hypothetical protein